MDDHRLIGELRRLRDSEAPPVDVADRVLAELPRLRRTIDRPSARRRLWMIAAAAAVTANNAASAAELKKLLEAVPQEG